MADDRWRPTDGASAGGPQWLTTFTWGYWGWGECTEQFVEAVDAVETSRGFAPPLFVDIRISRGVRARGFQGRAFERTVGSSRYRWMASLGNSVVLDGGTGIRIKDPATADDLLDLVRECSQRHQRIVFFCSCKDPGHEERGGCHRTAVARLLLQAAVNQERASEVIEWPGGDPLDGLIFEVPLDALRKVDRGAASILLGDDVSLAQVASIPWYSTAEIRAAGQRSRARVLTGPARFVSKAGWCLPVLGVVDELLPVTELSRRVRQVRAAGGFDARRTPHQAQ